MQNLTNMKIRVARPTHLQHIHDHPMHRHPTYHQFMHRHPMQRHPILLLELVHLIWIMKYHYCVWQLCFHNLTCVLELHQCHLAWLLNAHNHNFIIPTPTSANYIQHSSLNTDDKNAVFDDNNPPYLFATQTPTNDDTSLLDNNTSLVDNIIVPLPSLMAHPIINLHSTIKMKTPLLTMTTHPLQLLTLPPTRIWI